jgi:hypothetical protein
MQKPKPKKIEKGSLERKRLSSSIAGGARTHHKF